MAFAVAPGEPLSGGWHRYLRIRFLAVTLEHSRGDFRTAGPLPAPLSGVSLIVLQAVGVGLRNLAALQEQQTRPVCWHPGNKGFGVVKSGAQVGS